MRLLGARKEGVRKRVPSGANSMPGIFEVERGGDSLKELGPRELGGEWHEIKLERYLEVTYWKVSEALHWNVTAPKEKNMGEEWQNSASCILTGS